MTVDSSLERIATALETLLTAVSLAVPPQQDGAAPAAVSTPTPPPPPAVNTTGLLAASATLAPPPTTAPRRRRAASTPEQTQPVATPAATTATAPAAASAAAPPVGSSPLTFPWNIVNVKPDNSILDNTVGIITALAGDFGRDPAVNILKARNVNRVTELPADALKPVFDEAVATYAKLESAKRNQSLI